MIRLVEIKLCPDFGSSSAHTKLRIFKYIFCTHEKMGKSETSQFSAFINLFSVEKNRCKLQSFFKLWCWIPGCILALILRSEREIISRKSYVRKINISQSIMRLVQLNKILTRRVCLKHCTIVGFWFVSRPYLSKTNWNCQLSCKLLFSVTTVVSLSTLWSQCGCEGVLSESE